MVEVAPSDIVEFLQRAGGVGVIVVIDKKHGTIQGDFNRRVHIGRSAVRTRLQEARNLELMKISPRSKDHGNADRHVLTQRGRVLRVALESMGVREMYIRYVELQKQLSESTDELTEWILGSADDIWLKNTPESTFQFTDALKNPDSFPGGDVPDDFISYIDREQTLYDRVPDASDGVRKERIDPVEDIGWIDAEDIDDGDEDDNESESDGEEGDDGENGGDSEATVADESEPDSDNETAE